MWGKLSSILLPVFLKICSAASATFSSSIFKQPNKDSNVSAEWNDTGCVNDSTCVGWNLRIEFILYHRRFTYSIWSIYFFLTGSNSELTHEQNRSFRAELSFYLQQFQSCSDGLFGGNTFILIVSCPIYRFVYLFYQSTDTNDSSDERKKEERNMRIKSLNAVIKN